MSQCPQTPCPTSKVATGCLHSRTTAMCPTCRRESTISEDSLNMPPQGFCTGKYSQSLLNAEVQNSNPFLDQNATLNYQDQSMQTPMYGKKTQGSQTLNSNLDQDHSSVTQLLIGTAYEHPLFLGTLLMYPVMFSFVVTTNYEASVRTIYDHSQWRENAMYSGVQLELESHEEHGSKLEWTLSLKIREPNSGTVTKVTNMLCAMNFEEELTSLTCCSGLIVIQSSWKSRDLLSYLELDGYGSPPMLTHDRGIQM